MCSALAGGVTTTSATAGQTVGGGLVDALDLVPKELAAGDDPWDGALYAAVLARMKRELGYHRHIRGRGV